VLEVEAFRELDPLRVPAVPLPGLVAADQHDRAAVGVEGEQDPCAAVDARLLELAYAGSVDHVDVWPADRRTGGDDSGDLLRTGLMLNGVASDLVDSSSTNCSM
jgi:hypothetical protein